MRSPAALALLAGLVVWPSVCGFGLHPLPRRLLAAPGPRLGRSELAARGLGADVGAPDEADDEAARELDAKALEEKKRRLALRRKMLAEKRREQEERLAKMERYDQAALREPQPRNLIDRVPFTGKQMAIGAGGAVASYFAAGVVKRRYSARQKSLTAAYGEEMASIVKSMKGDSLLSELKACHKDYTTRLGPGQKRQDMFTVFMQKMITTSPFSVSQVQAVGQALDLFKLDEDKAAKWFVAVARSFKKKTGVGARATTLLLAERTLSSQGAIFELEKIRDLAAAGRPGGNQLVDVQLAALREKAYRDLILATPAKKRDDGPPPGADVLGLTPEKAADIYQATMENSEPDYLRYRPKTEAQNEMEQQEELRRKLLAVDGLTPEEVLEQERAKEQGKGSGSASASGAKTYECSQCGYTLFVAAGREEKFFPQNYKCPSCGAARDQFNAK